MLIERLEKSCVCVICEKNYFIVDILNGIITHIFRSSSLCNTSSKIDLRHVYDVDRRWKLTSVETFSSSRWHYLRWNIITLLNRVSWKCVRAGKVSWPLPFRLGRVSTVLHHRTMSHCFIANTAYVLHRLTSPSCDINIFVHLVSSLIRFKTRQIVFIPKFESEPCTQTRVA